MSDLTYQVDSNGVVKVVDGDHLYTLVPEQVAELPWVNTKPSRWDGLRGAVANQPLNAWVVYSGFPSVAELQRAVSVVSKMENTERSINKTELKLAVKRSVKNG